MRNKFLLYSALFLFCFVKLSHQIFFILDPFEERCIYKEMDAKGTFAGVYYLSGEYEDRNRASVKNAQNQVIWELIGHKNGNFNLEIQSAGVYSLCVESTAKIQMTVSFEFFDEKKNEQLISVHNISNLNSVIHSIRRKLDIIHSNMRNSAVRRNKHSEISSSLTSKITFYTAIKIIFVIIFSVFQILMLTSIFGNVKVVSKISLNKQESESSFSSTSSPKSENIFL